ncbi:MAG: HEAT repeat domain-containing protein [Gemmataceae bacterium]|nr:HEAT repeat domain-containing protein [Gemmataceae bacterium]MCI0737704.1 HEAT repeat domain-containing protein [Gemmataceae bacterium]
MGASRCALSLCALSLFAVFFPTGCSRRAAAPPTIKGGPGGSYGIEKALAERGPDEVSSGFFQEFEYAVHNGEFSLMVITDLTLSEVIGGGSGGSSTGETHGHWKIKNKQPLSYRCTFSTDEISSGQLTIGGISKSLANGRVFLVSTRDGVMTDVKQVDAPLVRAGLDPSPEKALKNLVKENAQVRGFLVAKLVDGLKDKQATRRNDAACFLYKTEMAREIEAAVLIDLLKDQADWTALAAAKGLWDLSKHEAAVPALVEMLQRKKLSIYARREVPKVLGEIGAAAKGAVPALREALKAQDEELRAVAEDALKKIEN